MAAGTYLGSKAALPAASLVGADSVVVIDASAGVRLVAWSEFSALFPTSPGADPNADRILFWDDSAGAYAYLTPGANLTITGTTIDASGGSSLPVADTTAIVQGSADATKRLRFEVDGLTAGQTRVMTVPDADQTLAGRDVNNLFSATQNFTASIVLGAGAATGMTAAVVLPTGGAPPSSMTDRAAVYCADYAAGDARLKVRSEQSGDVWLGKGTALLARDPADALEAATKQYVDSAVTGLLEFKGSTDCSANPDYPAASKGDAYLVSVGGRVGGAAGKQVDAGDFYVATADNAGGAEAAVGAGWAVLERNSAGVPLLAASNLSDLANAGAARTNLGLGTAAQKDTGTSGDAVPLLNAANTWSSTQTFTADVTIGASGGSGGGTRTVQTGAPASGAGNSLTLAASAAASGNSNGGDVTLDPGAPSGTGSRGEVNVLGKLDVVWGGVGLNVGADNNAATRTNATTKSCRITAPHYTNAEEPVGILVASLQGSVNELVFGGGSSIVNAATLIKFATGATATTTDGTVRMTIDQNGDTTLAEGNDLILGTSTGTKFGTATSQKLAFWNATPVVQQVLATGAGATVDQVIALLQTLGLCRQS